MNAVLCSCWCSSIPHVPHFYLFLTQYFWLAANSISKVNNYGCKLLPTQEKMPNFKLGLWAKLSYHSGKYCSGHIWAREKMVFSDKSVLWQQCRKKKIYSRLVNQVSHVLLGHIDSALPSQFSRQETLSAVKHFIITNAPHPNTCRNVSKWNGTPICLCSSIAFCAPRKGSLIMEVLSFYWDGKQGNWCCLIMRLCVIYCRTCSWSFQCVISSNTCEEGDSSPG